jgi:hypothetical protein
MNSSHEPANHPLQSIVLYLCGPPSLVSEALRAPRRFDKHYWSTLISAAYGKGLVLVNVEPPFAKPHEWLQRCLQRRIKRAYI